MRGMAASLTRQSKSQQRIWMVCFWSVFIIAIFQGLFACLWLFGLNRSFLSLENTFMLPWNRIAWFCFVPGWAIDFATGALLAPFALYGFENARRGYGVCSKSLVIWLIGHVVFAMINLFVIWFLWGAIDTTELLAVLIVRVGIVNIPICLWLCGVSANRAARQHMLEHAI
jgi:hypothetical protein